MARLDLVWKRVSPRHFAWQAWHNLTSTFVCIYHRFRVAGLALIALRGALRSGLGAREATAFCVAGVAQPYIHLRFTSQAWHNLSSSFVSRGQAWRSWHSVAPRLGLVWARVTPRHFLRGRRDTTLHPPSSHVAGVAPSYITFVLRGRGGTFGIRAWSGFVARDVSAVCVAGVVFGDIYHVAGVAQTYIRMFNQFPGSINTGKATPTPKNVKNISSKKFYKFKL